MKSQLSSRKATFNAETVGSRVEHSPCSLGASVIPSRERVGGASATPAALALGPASKFPSKLQDTEEVGKGGHRACVLGGMTRVGKPFASAILAASVGPFSYHVNRRRRPVVGGGKRRPRKVRKGKKDNEGERGVAVGRRGDTRGLVAAVDRGIQG